MSPWGRDWWAFVHILCCSEKHRTACGDRGAAHGRVAGFATLGSNDVGPTSATPFKDLLGKANGTNEAWLMLCSSSTTAMTIGYYAFQASNLQLLEVRAGGLLGSKAPWYHPMGSFWAAGMGYWLMREPLRSSIAASHVLLSAKAKAKSLLTWGRFPFWTILTNISQNIVESTNYSIFLGRSFNDFLRNYCAELRRCLKLNKLMLTFKLRG